MFAEFEYHPVLNIIFICNKYSESWIVAGSWASKYYYFCNLINVVHNVVKLSLQFENKSKYTTILYNWVNNSEVLLKILWFKLSNTISKNFSSHCEIAMLFICLTCLFFHLQVKFQGWFCSSWSMMLVGIWIFQFCHDSYFYKHFQIEHNSTLLCFFKFVSRANNSKSCPPNNWPRRQKM